MVISCTKMIEQSHQSSPLENTKNIATFTAEKNKYIQGIIRETILSIKTLSTHGLFSANDTSTALTLLTELYANSNRLASNIRAGVGTDDDILDELQRIINKLSTIICGFGTSSIDDLLFICFGSEFKNIHTEDEIIMSKYQLLKDYIIPSGYKIIQWKSNRTNISQSSPSYCSDKITENSIDFAQANTFECYDTDISSTHFYQRVYGIRIIIQNPRIRKTLIIHGIVRDIQIECLASSYINYQMQLYKLIADTYTNSERVVIDRLIDTRSLKDMLVYSENDIKKQVIEVLTEVKIVSNAKIEPYSETFIEQDMYSQRKVLMNLMMNHTNTDILYIFYILYDLISVSNSNTYDNEKHILYDSFPWKLKQQLKDSMKNKLKHTYDTTRKSTIRTLTLDQQICLLKVSDAIRDKAIVKLNEIKGKPDEITAKIRQYLEGFVRIPFGIYRKEPLLCKIQDMNVLFMEIRKTYSNYILNEPQPSHTKTKYTIVEMERQVRDYMRELPAYLLKNITKTLKTASLKTITSIIRDISSHTKHSDYPTIAFSNMNKLQKVSEILLYIKDTNTKYDAHRIELYNTYCMKSNAIGLNTLQTNIRNLFQMSKQVGENLDSIMHTLNQSVYSHNNAKRQIMKVIGQWMNGEQGGYCFGFEGSPGIGKTSLAKHGLTKCLLDDQGVSRPFAFISLGGSCNGSTLEGHGYTYMNSTWGRIVDILMETRCMNPIIYIDELDKVSNTDQGKEIIGILTHLIDATQNDAFQDKYFAGIDIDLSKVLFIFSYNDPDKIDKILLDRIHRIKFDNLSVKDKTIITADYILPDINNKMGFDNIITLEDEVIKYIIHHYTMEPGVRKLKEVLFDLYGEINLELMRSPCVLNLPYTITSNILRTKYLTNYQEIIPTCIHKEPRVGTMNGLWANNMGFGGIIPIQTSFYPSLVFLDLQLTGLQGDIMKESMSVAKSLAWNLIDNKIKKKWISEFNETKCLGLHIHCPEGSISKDGPSAGAAITTAIYSLLSNQSINPTVAITGEVNLSGEITAIGGLESKLTGGIRSGITTFLIPQANSHDFHKWKNKNQSHSGITIIEVSHITDVFKHIFP